MENKELNGEPAQLGLSQGSQSTPSKLELELQEALMEEKEETKYLASQIAAMKEEMAAKELSWEKERKELMKALESPITNPNQGHVWRLIQKKEQQICSLEKDLQEQVVKTERVTQYWKAEYDRVTEFWKEENDRITEMWEKETQANKAAYDKNLNEKKVLEARCLESSTKLRERDQQFMDSQAAWDTDYQRLRQISMKLNESNLEKDDLITQIINEKKGLKAQCLESSTKLRERDQEFMDSQAEWGTDYQSLRQITMKLNESIVEKEHLVICTMNERDVLEAELKEMSAQLEKKEKETAQREADWQIKHQALEDQLRCELTEKEAHLKRMQELESKAEREEQERFHNVTQVEEIIEALTKKNIELQELALMSDKDKAKIKKKGRGQRKRQRRS